VESLGEKLKGARESKGYSYDQVSRDTNIASRYIEAMEREDFSKFPAEAYLLGFLKNYGEYLGLDSQELLAHYRNLKLQELPTPVEQLLEPPSRAPKILFNVFLVILIAAAGGGGVYFFMNRPRNEPVKPVESRSPVEYKMEEPLMERRFYQGDSILITINTSLYKVVLNTIGETVALDHPSGPMILDLSQDGTLDLNDDGVDDLRITVGDFDKNQPAAGALLRIEQKQAAPLEPLETALPLESGAGGVTPGATGATSGAAAPAVQTPPAAPRPAANAPIQVIFTSPNAYPFTLQALFQGYCMFRWEVLAERDRRGRNERYFQKSDEINIPAQNGIRLWISNATAVKMHALGAGRTVPLEIGGVGEVVVADVRWVRNDDGRYRLGLFRLE
jgi:cytoskeletal protein RodZ